MAELRILVTGSRSWTDRYIIRRALLRVVRDRDPQLVTVVVGAARGADTLADQIARGYGWSVEQHPAGGFVQHGRERWRVRNQHMVDLGADTCLVFADRWDSGSGMCAPDGTPSRDRDRGLRGADRERGGASVPTLNYTTTIPVARTVGEVQDMLARHGAKAVAVRYAEGLPVGVSFVFGTPHGERTFTLPVDVAAMHRLLIAEGKAGKLTRAGVAKHTTPEHAARVAWRVIKDWLAAQLALIDAQMATLDQVMLPYMQWDGDQTVYEVYREREQRAIAGEAAQ